MTASKRRLIGVAVLIAVAVVLYAANLFMSTSS